MNIEPTSDSIIAGCEVRRFSPDDAAGVAQLVRTVYGDSYYPPMLYDPDQIRHLNDAGKLVSILGVSQPAGVIGHYALEPLPGSAVAEASDAIVAEDFRHHHLMEEMRVLLRAEANRIGLAGLVGYPVTNHLFSQKAEEHFGSHPCGVAPGLWPRSFHNMPEPLPQRMSFVIYFKYLRPVQEVAHVTTPHSEMLARIAGQWGIQVKHQDGAPPIGTGEMTVEHEPEVQTGTIRVQRVGCDTGSAIRQARARLSDLGAKAIALELPLAQPATGDISRQAEDEGFFFSGLGHAFAADGDALLLQFLAEDLDFSLIQIHNPFAGEMLDYVSRERDRLQRC